MTTNLNSVDHPDAFEGIQKRPVPPVSYGTPYECGKCHGHGCWNAGVHTKMACSNCDGTGYTSKQDHIHQWNYAEIGRCLSRATCTVCGATRDVDSGD